MSHDQMIKALYIVHLVNGPQKGNANIINTNTYCLFLQWIDVNHREAFTLTKCLIVISDIQHPINVTVFFNMCASIYLYVTMHAYIVCIYI